MFSRNQLLSMTSSPSPRKMRSISPMKKVEEPASMAFTTRHSIQA